MCRIIGWPVIYFYSYMSNAPVTDYIGELPEPAKSPVQRVYTLARQLVPGTTETVDYGMPCLGYGDKTLIGVMAAKKHLALYPFSGHIVSELKEKLDAAGFEHSTGTIRFQVDHELPEDLIAEIVLLRKAEIDSHEAKK
jgi:uncharacterized protein YdhG (YjbR/CyaY superfamily)